jgi:hypothetical protein
MKSHLVTYGSGSWRCTGCDHIRRRTCVVTFHHSCADRPHRGLDRQRRNARDQSSIDETKQPGPATGACLSLCSSPTAARAAVQAPSRNTTTLIPMPLSLIVVVAGNTTMPMINHLAMRHDGQNQQLVEQWVKLLQIRQEAENSPEVVLYREILTTDCKL